MQNSFRLLALLLALLMGLAAAQQNGNDNGIGIMATTGTLAGTQITNQATATFLDSANRPQTVQSNIVTTVVLPVYVLSVEPSGTPEAPGQTSLAGPNQTMTFSYILTNASNIEDTINLAVVQGAGQFNYTGFRVFVDLTCDGVPDGGPITQITLQPGQSVCLIVEADVPNVELNLQQSLINLVATSTGAPAVTDNDNWALGIVTLAANLTLFKEASPADTVQPGGTIDYRVYGSNIGDQAAGVIPGVVTVDGIPRDGIFLSDALPVGTTLVGPVEGSSQDRPVLIVYSNDGGLSWTTTFLPNATNVGMIILAPVPPGGTYEFNYGVNVPINAPAGSDIVNPPATIIFDGDPGPGVVPVPNTSNPSVVTVGAAPAVAVGPYQFPLGNAAGVYTFVDPTTGLSWNFQRDGDAQSVIGPVRGGQTISFVNTVQNTGNAPGTFVLTAEGVPAGWTVEFFTTDGLPVTELLMAQNEIRNVIVRVTPGQQVTTIAPTQITVRVTDPATGATDATINVVPLVTLGFGVDLSRNVTLDPNDFRVTDPGAELRFPLLITNTGVNPDSYDLSAILPPGWTVQFFFDNTQPQCDGLPDGVPITNTGLLSASEVQCLVAIVTVPEGQDAGAFPVQFIATSVTVPTQVTDSVQYNVTVTVGALVLTKTVNATEAVPGDELIYTITATNTGTGTLRQVRIRDLLPAYTDFVSVSVVAAGTTVPGTPLFSTEPSPAVAADWSATPPGSLPNSVVWVGIDTVPDGSINPADVMGPGQTITIQFVVRVR